MSHIWPNGSSLESLRSFLSNDGHSWSLDEYFCHRNIMTVINFFHYRGWPKTFVVTANTTIYKNFLPLFSESEFF